MGALFDLLSSDQQSLDLRTTAGGLGGRNVLQTERTRLSIFGGVVGAREKYGSTVDETKAIDVSAITGVDFLHLSFHYDGY